MLRVFTSNIVIMTGFSILYYVTSMTQLRCLEDLKMVSSSIYFTKIHKYTKKTNDPFVVVCLCYHYFNFFLFSVEKISTHSVKHWYNTLSIRYSFSMFLNYKPLIQKNNPRKQLIFFLPK